MSSKVGIIGRPNVGKSSLFNVLTRRRHALVKDQPGVTRDVLIESTTWWGRTFDVVDTGGLTESKDQISQLIRAQVGSFIHSFDALVVVMDGRTGLVPEDRDIVRLANESGKPYTIVVNKIDSPHKADLMLSEFYEFGEHLIPTSFENRDGIDEIVEWIKQKLPEKAEPEPTGIRLAVLGKPNVGKSTFCNRVLGEERQLVSEVAGTTMDSVELSFTHNDQEFIIVDTAGLRRPSKRKEGLEKLSAFKSSDSIRKADIVLLMVDVNHGLSHQDARMLEMINDQHKGVILVANKSDIAKEQQEAFRQKFRETLAHKFHFVNDMPLCFISANTGSGMKQLFEKVIDLWQKMNIRIPTSKLNDFFYEAIRNAPAPVYGTQNVKFYYLTQTRQVPPAFLAFANHPDGVTPAYRRFLVKQLQQKFDLQGVPLRIFCMGSK